MTFTTVRATTGEYQLDEGDRARVLELYGNVMTAHIQASPVATPLVWALMDQAMLVVLDNWYRLSIGEPTEWTASRIYMDEYTDSLFGLLNKHMRADLRGEEVDTQTAAYKESLAIVAKGREPARVAAEQRIKSLVERRAAEKEARASGQATHVGRSPSGTHSAGVRHSG